MQPQRELPSTEQSLKFMAWDVKKNTEAQNKIADSQSTMVSALSDIANSLKIMIGILRATPKQSSGDVPF